MDKQALSRLGGFTGTENYFHMGGLFPGFVYTDGVKFLAENADAYWLLQAIASYQHECKKDSMLRERQFWTLKPIAQPERHHPMSLGAVIASKRSDETPHMAELVCERDSDDVAFTQKIKFTDFPFDAFPKKEVRIWVAPTEMENGPVMAAYLPSEH